MHKTDKKTWQTSKQPCYSISRRSSINRPSTSPIFTKSNPQKSWSRPSYRSQLEGTRSKKRRGPWKRLGDFRCPLSESSHQRGVAIPLSPASIYRSPASRLSCQSNQDRPRWKLRFINHQPALRCHLEHARSTSDNSSLWIGLCVVTDRTRLLCMSLSAD